MRFNSENKDWAAITTEKVPGVFVDSSDLRFNEVNSIDDIEEDNEDDASNEIPEWKKGYSDYADNTINWGSSDYPNNPAKSKV